MATYVKGDAVANATKYDLKEKASDGTYTTLVEDASEINFEVSALGLAEGDHTLVVVAQADGYTDSDPSNEVVYTVAATSTEDEGTDSGGGDSGSGDSGDSGDSGESGDSGSSGDSGDSSGTVTTLSYTTTGYYISNTDGTEVSSASWIHSDLIDITTLADNTDGYCTSALQGHAKVANIAYYSSNDLSTYLSSVTYTTGETKQYTVEEIQASAPEGATYVNFSTHSGCSPLQVAVIQ